MIKTKQVTGLKAVIGDEGLSVGVGVTVPATEGVIEAANDIIAFSSSDTRWKREKKLIEAPLDKLDKLSGITFKWVEDSKNHPNKGSGVGVIAQEVEEVFPELVNTRITGMKAVKYEGLIPLLIECIKEQQKQIEKLKCLYQAQDQ